MRRSIVSSLFVASCLALTTLVLGQGRATRPVSKPKPKATTTSATKDSRTETSDEKPKAEEDPYGPMSGGTAPASSAATESPVEPGVQRSNATGDGGVRSSPLNPRPEEFPDGGAVATPVDLDKIMGDIAVLRARVAAIGDVLFKSRIVLRVETRGDHAKIGKLSVSLDEGIVYTAPPGFFADDEVTVYDHAVAPGRHVLGVDVERRDDRGETFRTGQHSRVTLDIPENQRLETSIRIDDDSDMGSDFPSSQKGGYDLRVRVRAKARK
ncbi:MAG TPA: hypothetical protein VK550_05795 [Polyangiaceae bacterium]|nr:hypothetical protein [Polyangiaceae bacterium]